MVLALAVESGHAQVFNDLASFQTAAGSVALETFESYPPGTQLDMVPALGIGFSMLNDLSSFPSVQLRNSTGGDVVSGTNVFLNDIDFALPGLGTIEFEPLDIGDAIYAVGYFNTGGDDTTTLTLYDDSDNILLSGSSVGSPGFVGLVSSTPGFRVEIAEFTGNGYFTLDDLYVRVDPVPEPSSIGISVALAMLAVGFRCRRNKS